MILGIHKLMDYHLLMLLFVLVGMRVVTSDDDGGDATSFEEKYYVTWGNDHVSSMDQGRQIQLTMDAYSGSGFASKLSYGSGFFNLRIKLPDRDSAGVVTAFYLTSESDKHDEMDIEFLGNKEGKPSTLQTNVFCNGVGDREQRTLLWFDPTTDFHSYKLLWNEHQIVFYVDEVPIRVFKNHVGSGVCYPSQPLQIEASLWDGDSWATDGGRTKTDWSYAPFKAYFEGFSIDGCSSTDMQHCHSSSSSSSQVYWWNSNQYWELSATEQKRYKEVREKYMNYDYCYDRARFPTPPPECLQP